MLLNSNVLNTESFVYLDWILEKKYLILRIECMGVYARLYFLYTPLTDSATQNLQIRLKIWTGKEIVTQRPSNLNDLDID